ncbi:MAG: MFS transporter [Planctomycetes bacterium]|nr:MFS transporter [Planctomycetota bacterium]
MKILRPAGPPPPPSRPTRARWAVLAALCSLAFLTYLDRICIMQAQGAIEKDLNFDRLTAADEEALRRQNQEADEPARAELGKRRATSRMSWVFAAFLLGYLLFEVPGGWLGDRWGPRWVIFRIVLWWSLFTALTGLVPWLAGWFTERPEPALLLGILVAVRFLFGLGEAGAYPNLARALGRWFPIRERASAQGFIWLASRIGGAAAPLIIGFLVKLPEPWGGWQRAFVILGGAGAVWAIAFFLWFRDRPEDKPSVNEAERQLIRGEEALSGTIYDDRRQPGVPWRHLATSTNLLSIYGVSFFVSFSFYFFITFLPKYLKEVFKVDYAHSELTSGLPLFCGGLACLLGGKFSDHLVARFGSKRWGRSVPGMIGLGAAGLCMLLAILASWWNLLPATVTLLCLAFFFQDLAVPPMWSLPADVGGRYAGTVGGFMNAMGAIGGGLSPIITAQAANRFGWNSSYVLLLFAVSYFLGVWAWFRVDAGKAILCKKMEGE